MTGDEVRRQGDANALENQTCLEAEAEWLRQERMERFNELVGLDEQGRGRIPDGRA